MSACAALHQPQSFVYSPLQDPVYISQVLGGSFLHGASVRAEFLPRLEFGTFYHAFHGVPCVEVGLMVFLYASTDPFSVSYFSCVSACDHLFTPPSVPTKPELRYKRRCAFGYCLHNNLCKEVCFCIQCVRFPYSWRGPRGQPCL